VVTSIFYINLVWMSIENFVFASWFVMCDFHFTGSEFFVVPAPGAAQPLDFIFSHRFSCSCLAPFSCSSSVAAAVCPGPKPFPARALGLLPGSDPVTVGLFFLRSHENLLSASRIRAPSPYLVPVLSYGHGFPLDFSFFRCSSVDLHFSVSDSAVPSRPWIPPPDLPGFSSSLASVLVLVSFGLSCSPVRFLFSRQGSRQSQGLPLLGAGVS
jgi:hypothetical protein